MKHLAAAACACLFLISMLWAGQAATRPSDDAATAATKPAAGPASPRQPQQLDLALVWIADTQPFEYLYVLGGQGGLRDGLVGHRSLDSLKRHIANLPAGSTITWAPGCRRLGNEPLLSSPEDMAAFKKFCADYNVTLVIIPSG